MNADQIAEIRPAIREAIDGAPDTCVTLEAHGDPGKWMQVTDRTINAAYPHEDHPQERLKALPAMAGLQVTNWKARKFATFELPELDVTPLAHWIDAYFVAVLACTAGDYHLDTACEKL
jgi:hypothetical protein